MEEKIYTCECGKIFNNPQSFNGHKYHCRDHYIAKYGDDKKYNEMLLEAKRRGKLGSQKVALNKLIQKENLIKNWLSSTPKCEGCGKVITEKFGSGRFCCLKCAHKRTLSEESKQKISNTLKLAALQKGQSETTSQIHKTRDKYINKKPRCFLCGKILSNKTKTGLCLNCLTNSDIGKNIKSQLGKDAYNKSINKHTSWMPRNIKPLTESICEDLLTQNGVLYTREKKEKHIKQNYSLDFYIEKKNIKIDLEIDGKQHNYADRVELDKIRDNFLSDKGYLIYRIKFTNIKSNKKLQEFKDKIKEFIEFYNSL